MILVGLKFNGNKNMFGNKKDDELRIPEQVAAEMGPQFSGVHESLREIKQLIEEVKVFTSQKNPTGEPRPGGHGSDLESGHAVTRDYSQSAAREHEVKLVQQDVAINSEQAAASACMSVAAGEEAELAKLHSEVERLDAEMANTREQLNNVKSEAQTWINERDIAVRERDDNRDKVEQLESIARENENKAVELQNQISSLNDRAELLKTELRQATQKLEECQNQLQECSGKLSQANQGLEDRDNRIVAYNQKVAGLDGVMAMLQHENTTLVGERDALTQEKETLTQDKHGLLAEKQSLTNRLLADEKLESLMWPEFLAQPEMLSWRESLQHEILQDEPNNSVVLMIACLFSYNAAVRMGKDWQKRLIDVLYDFSFAFFRWNKDRMVSNGEAVNNANLWAGAFNTSCEGLVKISVPEPDEPFDKRSMVSYQGTGGSSLDVESVRSWCIQDESGRIMKQAEVTTR